MSMVGIRGRETQFLPGVLGRGGDEYLAHNFFVYVE